MLSKGKNQYAYFSTYFECHWTTWKYLNCVPEFQDNGVFITVNNKSHLKTSQRLGRGSSKTLPAGFPFWIRTRALLLSKYVNFYFTDIKGKHSSVLVFKPKLNTFLGLTHLLSETLFTPHLVVTKSCIVPLHWPEILQINKIGEMLLRCSCDSGVLDSNALL